LIIRRTP